MSKRNLPTVEDVARSAGVSTATVSRCINMPGKVSEETRKRVQAAIDKLQYSPNFGARAIAANRTGMFGAIMPTMENAIFARGIEAFQAELVRNGATMLAGSSGYNSDQEAKLIRTMVARGADGLLLIGTDRDREIYDFLRARNIPFVIAWAISTDPAHSYVGFDNFSASRRLVTKAIGMGHRRFAIISARTEMNDRARDRVKGSRQAILDAGLDAGSVRVIETSYSTDNGASAFHEILQSGDKPTLFICGNDVLAAGVIQAARASGLKVPDDVSVIGFDDIELARIVEPGLTTIHVPHREMGSMAARSLLTLTDEPQAPIRITLETGIVERDSLGEPKS